MSLKPPLFLLCLMLSIPAFSQTYTNDWIDKTGTRKYFKIKITTEGIYRIDYAFLEQQLTASGVNISSVDPGIFRSFTMVWNNTFLFRANRTVFLKQENG